MSLFSVFLLHSFPHPSVNLNWNWEFPKFFCCPNPKWSCPCCRHHCTKLKWFDRSQFLQLVPFFFYRRTKWPWAAVYCSKCAIRKDKQELPVRITGIKCPIVFVDLRSEANSELQPEAKGFFGFTLSGDLSYKLKMMHQWMVLHLIIRVLVYFTPVLYPSSKYFTS